MKKREFELKRYGKKSLIKEMIDLYQEQGYKPPFVLISKNPVHVTQFKEIKLNVVDENCPKDIWYLVEKRYYEKYVKPFKAFTSRKKRKELKLIKEKYPNYNYNIKLK